VEAQDLNETEGALKASEGGTIAARRNAGEKGGVISASKPREFAIGLCQRRSFFLMNFEKTTTAAFERLLLSF
jgi:hypothetical protein